MRDGVMVTPKIHDLMIAVRFCISQQIDLMVIKVEYSNKLDN